MSGKIKHASLIRLYEIARTEKHKDIAAELNVAPSVVTNWAKRGVSKDGALKAARIWGGSATYILSGDGQPISEINNNSKAVEAWTDESTFDDDIKPFMFLKDITFQSGGGGEIVPDDGNRKLLMSLRTLEACGVDAKHVVATVNQGDSNAPEILSGDTIWIDQSKKRIVADEFYAINHSGSLRIKLLDITGNKLRVRSYSDDKKTYPDEFYTLEEMNDEIQVIGWVFHWSRIKRWKW